MITEVRRGSVPVWTRNVTGDDFDREDATTLGDDWTDLGTSTDFKLGITNGMVRVQIPEGLIGGFFDLRTSSARYNQGVGLADDGYVEVRAGSRGDGFSPTSLSGFGSAVYGRGNNSGSTFSNGVGINFQAGTCSIVTVVSGAWASRAEGGTFQAGDRLRLTFIGNVHTLYVNGTQRAQWTDSGNVVLKGASYRSLIIRSMGGKDLLGPRRFGPMFDAVTMA